MKIVRKEKSCVIEFNELVPGDCFEYTGKVFIKISGKVLNIRYMEEDINCFCFTTNKLDYILSSTLITPLNMELREV